jgi:hypothetical protein
MGVITITQYPEHDNVFPGMLSCHFYCLPYSNRGYAGRTVVDAQLVEAMVDQIHPPHPSRCLYRVANRGLPMNPQEVDDLIALINNPHLAPINRAEGYLLIRELCHITTFSACSWHDRAMTVVMSDECTAPTLVEPFPCTHHTWDHEPLAVVPMNNPAVHCVNLGIPIPKAN